MFTGIVKGQGKVISLSPLEIHFPTEMLPQLELGASVAVDGVCLTVTRIETHAVFFDVIEETLRCTTLGTLKPGDLVNLERSARFGDEIGGHLLSGHVIDTVEIIEAKANVRRFACPWMRYIFPKGYVAIDGISLTVVETTPDSFTVHLIPETLARTSLGWKGVGDRVNLEIDSQTQVIVDTVQRLSLIK